MDDYDYDDDYFFAFTMLQPTSLLSQNTPTNNIVECPITTENIEEVQETSSTTTTTTTTNPTTHYQWQYCCKQKRTREEEEELKQAEERRYQLQKHYYKQQLSTTIIQEENTIQQEIQELQLSQQSEYYNQTHQQTETIVTNPNPTIVPPQHYKDFLQNFSTTTLCSPKKSTNSKTQEEIKKYIVDNIAYINFFDPKDYDILHKIIKYNLTPILDLLIKNKVNLCQQYYSTQLSILHVAIKYESYECFKMLVENIDKNAINLKDTSGNTALIYLCEMLYIDYNKYYEYLLLLLKHGANINAKNQYNNTAAHLCIKHCKWTHLHLLIACGADTSNVPQHILDDALQYAINNHDLESIKILTKEYGVETFSQKVHPKYPSFFRIKSEYIDNKLGRFVHVTWKHLLETDLDYINLLVEYDVLQHPLFSIFFDVESHEALKKTKFYNALIKNGFCEAEYEPSVFHVFNSLSMLKFTRKNSE